MTREEIKAFERLIGRKLSAKEIEELGRTNLPKWQPSAIDKALSKQFEINPAAVSPRWGNS